MECMQSQLKGFKLAITTKACGLYYIDPFLSIRFHGGQVVKPGEQVA